MDSFILTQGQAPLVVSLPHAGTSIPYPVAKKMSHAALEIADTDWHLEKLYDFATELGATVLQARHSRYVVDLNRDPNDKPLYPGQNSTGLAPTISFANAPLYRPGHKPAKKEIAKRIEKYWQPYHLALQQQLARLKQKHGCVVLYDGHSIRTQVPYLFAGKLNNLNLGTNSGKSCHPDLQKLATEQLEKSDYSHVVNGRFKGGYITRHYGQPHNNIHALQMEITQASYMDENSFDYTPDKAEKLKAFLKPLLAELVNWAEKHSRKKHP